jgi:hypothetical protein
MKKFLIFAGCALTLALSCSKEADLPETLSKDGETFYARVENVDAKVFADDQLRVLWHQNDLVSIFNKYTYNKQYKFNGNTGDNAGSFSEVPGSEFVTGNALPLVYAVYPYNEATSISNDGAISLTFPATQSYSKNSFGIGANPMVSVSEDNNLLFKNVGGYLMLKFYGEACIKTIELSTSRKIAGAASVTMDLGGTPAITMADNAATKITLDCGEGVLVGATEANYTEFWFALPPVALSDGFTVKVTDVYGQTFSKKTNNALTIERNHLEKMAPIELNMPHESGDNIVFADDALKAILVGAPGINTNGDSEISFAEAAAVRSFPSYLFTEKSFETFNEFKYFTHIYEIPERLFYGCWSLKEITLPANISSIGASAFEMCTALTALDVPASCKSVSNYAFSECNNLKTLIFRSTTTLDLNYLCFGMTGNCPTETLIIYAEQAFDPGMHYSGVANGNGLKVGGTVYVPAKSIVRYQELWHQMESRIKPIPETFDENIVFADANVKNWIIKWTGWDDVPFDINGDGEISYREAAAIKEIPPQWFDPGNSYSFGKAPEIVSFDEFEYFYGLEYISTGCFVNSTKLASIRIPRSITTINPHAFDNCEALTRFTAPRNMTYLADYAFEDCSNLKNVTLFGDSLSFGPFCFEDCNLESLTLYSLSLPVYDHDPNIAENMKFLLYGGHVQTLYTPNPSLYQGNPEWRSGNAVDNYAMIPDYEVYYHTHY